RYFIEHRGATLSRDEILKEVWGYSAETFTRTVDVHVASLRQKLEDDPKQPAIILTVTRLGYKFALSHRNRAAQKGENSVAQAGTPDSDRKIAPSPAGRSLFCS